MNAARVPCYRRFEASTSVDEPLGKPVIGIWYFRLLLNRGARLVHEAAAKVRQHELRADHQHAVGERARGKTDHRQTDVRSRVAGRCRLAAAADRCDGTDEP